MELFGGRAHAGSPDVAAAPGLPASRPPQPPPLQAPGCRPNPGVHAARKDAAPALAVTATCAAFADRLGGRAAATGQGQAGDPAPGPGGEQGLLAPQAQRARVPWLSAAQALEHLGDRAAVGRDAAVGCVSHTAPLPPSVRHARPAAGAKDTCTVLPPLQFAQEQTPHQQAPRALHAQIRELMGLLGNDQQDRCAHCGCLPAPSAPAPALAPEEPGRRQGGRGEGTAGAGRGKAMGREAGRGSWGRRVRGLRASCRAPAPTDSALPPAGAAPPWAPANLLQPTAVPSLNAALLQTQTHLGDIVGMLGPLQDQLLTQNQHVEQLRGSFDQTMSLAVGFILGSVATQRGVLGKPS
ncbi:undifferentiated embryonic cell transcription factor 1-like [Dipodomys merriami]|uniref:undifferentiated embryonic cell transcription factor 1-like n=1 Tax=Dipodomys merriami TaxID=94247 RepID=UPI0038559A20